MHYRGFAGLDQGWFRLEMQEGSPIPKEASIVYYGFFRIELWLFPFGDVSKKRVRPYPEASFVYSFGFAGLDHGWFRFGDV